MADIFIKGFLVGSGLIIAIGAQNAFVLSKGIKKEHHIIIPLICSLSDAFLIMLGVTGMGGIIAGSSSLYLLAAVFGALFLYWYGFKSFMKIFRDEILEAQDNNNTSLKASVLTTLGVTLLNPHVYLDTVILLGAVSSQFKEMRYIFGLGAASASFVWFFALSFGGTFLSGFFKKPFSWKVLDSAVALTMWWIATTLLYNGLNH